ncbi:hypothetical protein [Streptomyces sirii]|uniref:hypothetical protein n=1 Tax=Streptomyces sirii TaxID=3127701 RepID=UPI003D35C90A
MPSMNRPVHLGNPFPVAEIEPFAGCDVCMALAAQRAAARAVGDSSKAIDCHIEIGRHPHAEAAQP